MYHLCVNRQRDLNCRTSFEDLSCVELLKKPDAHKVRFESDDLAVIPSPTMRKLFDVLTEVSENSRGDWTPLELFLAGSRALALESRFNDPLRLIVRVERKAPST
jgi:hypothetical protein